MSIPLERFFQQPPLWGRSLTEVEWHPTRGLLSFLEPCDQPAAAGQSAVFDLWTYDLEAGNRTLCVAGRDLCSGELGLSLRGYQWFPDGERLLLVGSGGAWEYRLADGNLHQLISQLDDRVPPAFAPDGQQLAFIRANDLGVLDLAAGKERMLTSDGSPTLLNGVLDWVYWEELGNRKSWLGFEWSPNSQHIAFLQLDQSRVPEYPLLDWMARYPAVTLQRYPKSGDPNSTPSIHLVQVADGKLTAQHREVDDQGYLAPYLTWAPNSSAVAFTRVTRDQRSLELRLLGNDGEGRCLLTEQDPHWLNRIGPPVFLPGGDFLWSSERTGRAHLYRYASTGDEQRAITGGDWQVEAVHGTDGRSVYLTGTGEDPRERHLYRAGLDAVQIERLTEGGGVHQSLLRDDCAWAMVTRQSPTSAPESALLHLDGLKWATIRRPNPSYREHQWPEATFPELIADDGTRLYGRLLLPLDFDANKRYPVVVHVYGGPHAQTVQKGWTGNDPLEQILARAGFLVWRLDNRGSWGRGHGFEIPVNQRLGESELADQLTGVEYLRSLPYVDPERIGITGWSYGGYLTLYAMTHAPDFWRCGVAGAPVTDWSLYDSIYTERYMGTPQSNPEGYRASSPVNAVERLSAPLLLAHGTDDDNVHLQHTVQFVEALSRHRKPYELLIQPKQTHGFKGEGPEIYLHERMLEFFRRHLQG